MFSVVPNNLRFNQARVFMKVTPTQWFMVLCDRNTSSNTFQIPIKNVDYSNSRRGFVQFDRKSCFICKIQIHYRIVLNSVQHVKKSICFMSRLHDGISYVSGGGDSLAYPGGGGYSDPSEVYTCLVN